MAYSMTTDSKQDVKEKPATKKLGSLRRLVPFLSPYKLQITLAAIALTFAAIAVLLFGQGLRSVIDLGFATGSMEGLTKSLGLVFLTVLLLAAATFGRFFAVSWLGERLVADLRKAVFDKLIGQSPEFFETNKVGELTSRITTDSPLIQTVVGSSASMALRNVLLAIGGSVMLLITSLKLTAVLFLVLPTVLIPVIFYGRRVRRLSKDSQDKVATVSALTEESLSAIRVVQANTHEPIDKLNFAEGAESAFDVAVSRIKARAFLVAAVITLVFGATCLMFWVGGRDVILGQMSAGTLAEFVFYAIIVASALGAISEVYGELQRAAGATERLAELLDMESKVVEVQKPKALPEGANGPALAFDTVSFSYPTRPDSPALDNLSLNIGKGESVAIVGASGAGKSSLFQLLLRFYDPQSGGVKVNGVELHEMALTDLRDQFAWVSQDAVIFSGTIADNIAYGRTDATDEEIRSAAEVANALEFIEQLPKAFETFVGEKGVRLSGGQRQRLALARAVLRDAPILLLDEATSALDAESELKVQKALTNVMVGRTNLIIAHRFSTIRDVDRVIVMEQGKIIEQGSPADLMKRNGVFQRLAQMQSLSAN